MTYRLVSIVPIWVLAIVGAVLVGTLARPSGMYGWLGIVLGITVLLTFIVQLALPTNGLVMRMAASIGGAVIILAVATGILVLAGA